MLGEATHNGSVTFLREAIRVLILFVAQQRFLMFQKNSALAQWYRMQTTDHRGTTRKTMIVALARKLLVALWQLVTTGEVPEGVVLRPAV